MTQTVRLTVTEDTPIKIRSVTVKGEGYTATTKTVKAGREYLLSITPQQDLKAGEHVTIEAKTDAVGTRAETLKVQAHVVKATTRSELSRRGRTIIRR